jgi:Trk K+ transport system NAD-binding subunit
MVTFGYFMDFVKRHGQWGINAKKLLRAGANRVVLPYLIGGQKMAQAIIRPAVIELLKLAIGRKSIELEMEEFMLLD